MDFVGGPDGWDYSQRPQPRRQNRSSFYLDADPGYGGGLYRTRSQGARPQPVINVYNDQMQRNDGPMPGAFPAYSPQPSPGYALDREYERGRRLNDELADEIRDLRLERSRVGRSRSRSHNSHSPSSDYYRHEIERIERERQQRLDRDRITAELEKKKRDEAQREKDAEAHYREKIEREKREAKEREDELYNKFLLKQKEDEEKKKKKEKEHKEEIEAELRKRLAERGYSGREIENIVSDKKEKTITSTSLTITKSGGTPTYSKVHKEYLSVETLKYYNIPYTWDEVSLGTPKPKHNPLTRSQRDSDYIIILQEMDKHETNILFEHTKALRAGRLLIDAPKKEKEYAFFRKHERSKSRSRRRGSGEWKSFGILEYKK